MSDATLFGLLRHGETVWNRQRRIQGRRDSPLTPEGALAVARWAVFLGRGRWNWARILASPAGRARETAAILGRSLRVPIEEDMDLREQDWGLWEGLRWHEVRQRFGPILEEQVAAGWHFRPPGGESRQEVWSRARAALARHGAGRPGQQLLVVSHQGLIKALVYAVERRRFLPDEPGIIDPDRLQTLRWHADALSAAEYNIGPDATP